MVERSGTSLGRRFGRASLAARAAAQVARAGSEMAAGAGLGFLSGLAKAALTGSVVPLIGTSLAGMGAGLAFRIGREQLAGFRGRLFDTPAGADLLAHIRRHEVDVGVTAARREGAWVVFPDAKSGPMVLSDAEYERFRDGFSRLNEIVASGDTVTVRRYRDGLLDSSHTAAPAVLRFSISKRTKLSEAWYVEGHETTGDEAFAAYEARRIANPAEPNERPRYMSSRIVEADRARRETGADRRSRIAREMAPRPEQSNEDPDVGPAIPAL